jgi:putative ABC transport system substrate-binding protein
MIWSASEEAMLGIRRREFITLLGGAAAWPLAARAQQAIPVVCFISAGSVDGQANYVAAFRRGLSEAGYVEGRNASIEYYWLEGQYDRLPMLMSDIIHRRVAVITTPASTPATLAAKAATSAIPIIFGVGDDPVRLGLVASLARPGGNATGVNFFSQEVVPKRLGLLHELVPKATRIAVLTNPANQNTAFVLKQIEENAGAIGLQIDLFKASTIREIDTAFESIARKQTNVLFVAPDTFFADRRVQLVTLATRDRILTSFGEREAAEAGGLMSYGTDILDMFHQVGIYTGRILKGEKPPDLPVMQSTKFQFVINLQTARALSLDVPPTLLASADKVIE